MWDRKWNKNMNIINICTKTTKMIKLTVVMGYRFLCYLKVKTTHVYCTFILIYNQTKDDTKNNLYIIIPLHL